MVTRYISVLGTWGWPADPTDEWWYPDSAFARFLSQRECVPAHPGEPFVWSGDVDGVPMLGGGRDWDAAAHALKYYLQLTPYEDRNVIAHSHGGQVALLCAQQGVQIRSLILVGTPVRRDIEQDVAPLAIPHLGVCRQIIDAKADKMGWFGALFDRRVSVRRGFRVPGITVERLPHIGHSGILREPGLFHLWDDQGWLDLLRGHWSDDRTAA